MEGKEKYINPFTDFGFKRLFGSEFNKELLIDFLNQVLQGKEQIQDLTYLNTENQGRTEADRKAVFDLYCENERGEKIIIELQNAYQLYFKDRSIYYATFPLQEQALKGQDWDYRLRAVYTIGILNFSFPDHPGRDRYLREVQLLDKQTHEVFYDKLTFLYLETPRFRKREEELETPFEKWVYVLQHLPKLQERPLKLQEKIFDKLFAEAEIAKLKPEDMNAYEQSLKVYRDNYSVMKTAEIMGMEKGMEKGMEMGKEEEKKEIAKRLKKKGLDLETIIEVTGLTKEQIQKLEEH
ncbi:Rpn family recombination-promoting nuclease/putative transposase [soil metagenome]